MSLLKNILSPFVEFKDEKKDTPATVTQTIEGEKSSVPPEPKAGAVKPAVAPSPPAYTASSSANPQYGTYFDNLIEEANAKNPLFAGTDFKEFMESKIDVEAIADEETKYKTAFNVLKRTGLTKEKLVSTGRQYLSLIEQDLKGFEQAYTQQYKTEVEGKEQLLQKKKEEAQALTEKIATLNEDVKRMSVEVAQSKDGLNRNKDSFILAGEHKKQEIQTELEKIDQYFK
jgi:hypothetical protein